VVVTVVLGDDDADGRATLRSTSPSSSPAIYSTLVERASFVHHHQGPFGKLSVFRWSTCCKEFT
jgi:hypothetical protein